MPQSCPLYPHSGPRWSLALCWWGGPLWSELQRWPRRLRPGTDAGRLRKGLNIIQIDQTCTELQFSIDNNASKNTAVIFGKLDIINTAKPLNTKLSYNKINQDTAYKQILADIKALDPEFNFYYNAVINNESALDLNTSDDTDTLKDNPLNWYNYNNINNKFVISEIDADYLKDHIVIAKNSKL